MNDFEKLILKIADATGYDYSDDIIMKWKEIVGPKLYLKVFLTKVDKRTIYIKAESPGFKTLAKMKEKEILSNINKYFPDEKINKIHIE